MSLLYTDLGRPRGITRPKRVLIFIVIVIVIVIVTVLGIVMAMVTIMVMVIVALLVMVVVIVLWKFRFCRLPLENKIFMWFAEVDLCQYLIPGPVLYQYRPQPEADDEVAEMLYKEEQAWISVWHLHTYRYRLW